MSVLEGLYRAMMKALREELEKVGPKLEEGRLVSARNVLRVNKYLTKSPFEVVYVIKLLCEDTHGGGGYIYYLMNEQMDKMFDYYDGK